MELESVGVVGVITGKALYSGGLRFEEAVALSRFGVPASSGAPIRA